MRILSKKTRYFFDNLFDVLTLFDKKSLTLSFNSVIMDNDDAYEK